MDGRRDFPSDASQQRLFESRLPDWFVDEPTRIIGRNGVGEAREELRKSLRRGERS
jgi:hypothetical protein